MDRPDTPRELRHDLDDYLWRLEGDEREER
jgi:hypothetical protein